MGNFPDSKEEAGGVGIVEVAGGNLEQRNQEISQIWGTASHKAKCIRQVICSNISFVF